METEKNELVEQILEVVNRDIIEYIKAIVETSACNWLENIPSEAGIAFEKLN